MARCEWRKQETTGMVGSCRVTINPKRDILEWITVELQNLAG